jgi:hypothetical protein
MLIAVGSQSISGMSTVNPLRPKLITYLQSLIEVNPMSMSIHISSFFLRPYYTSQLAMWIHYWHSQTQIWIEIAMTDG